MLHRRWNYVMDVMDLVEKEAVLSPLQVLSILALNPKLPLHVASNYMSGILKVMTRNTHVLCYIDHFVHLPRLG